MSTKKSAFQVFKTHNNKSNKVLQDVAQNMSNTTGEGVTLKNMSKKKSTDDLKDDEHNKDQKNPTTPSSKIKTGTSKSEPRFTSIRKSIRKKVKKEAHHEIEFRTKTREKPMNGVLQVLERNSGNWADNVQDLNSSSLEATFLPEVRKYKKEQEELHKEKLDDGLSQSKSSSTPNIERILSNSALKKRPNSSLAINQTDSDDIPVPIKKIKKAVSTNSPRPESGAHTGEDIFSWMISPIKLEQFFSEVWQTKPLFIRRRQPLYNKNWFTSKELDQILKTKNIQFTKNIDIAVFRNGKRETLNPDGRAFAPIVWKFYQEGCSIRFLNPQTYSKNLWYLTSRLQEYFGCFVGTNMYLTPPDSQGFAPHYDDIEAFIIQLEGEKHWKLYAAREPEEILPRHSSKNLSVEELGEPILDRILKPGDCLYFPRGVIHQALTTNNSHSLHITVSVYQKSCWSDFMEKLVPIAVQTAIEEDIEFRKGLPLGYSNYLGVSNSEKNCDERKSFMKTVQQLMKKLVSYVAVDEAADELMVEQMEEYLPPFLSQDETDCSILSNGLQWNEGAVDGNSKLSSESEVRIIRPAIARIVAAGDNVEIVHTMENSRQYKETPLQSIQIPLEHADIAEFFLGTFPAYVKIQDAPSDDNKLKISIANKLFNAGILRTKLPFNC